MTRRAVSYLRVSSIQQAASDRWGLARQQQDVARYAGSAELQITETFRDSITGSSTTRKGLTDLKTFCAKHSVKVVIISSIDRLARDVSASYKLLAEFIELGVEIHSADHGPIDLSVEESTINFSLRTLFSHLERNKIAARTQAARLAMAEKNLLPNGMRNYGLRNAGGQAIIHPAEAATVRRVYEWAASGMTHHAIGLKLDAEGVKTYSALQDPEHEHRWTKQTISGMIRNEVYKGTYRWGRFAIPVPAIVSEELWQRAQPPRRGPRPVLAFPLTGHIRCGVCGRRMSGRTRKRKSSRTEYYRCNGHGLPNGCTAPELRRDYIEPLAERLIQDTLGDPELLAELLGANTKIPEGVSEQLAEIEAEDARWLEAFRLGAISPAELSGYRTELAAKRRALESVEPQAPTHLEAYARVLKDAPLTEALEASDLVIIASHDSCRLTLEPR